MLDAAALGEGAALALRGEAEVLQLHQHRHREAVVQLRHVDVLGLDPGLAKRAFGRDRTDLVDQIEPVVGAGAEQPAVVGGVGVPDAVHPDRRVTKIPRSVLRRDDVGVRPAGGQTAVEQVERLADVGRIDDVVDRDRLSLQGPGVHVGVLATCHRDRRHLLSGGAVLVHVALGGQAVERDDAERAVGDVELQRHRLLAAACYPVGVGLGGGRGSHRFLSPPAHASGAAAYD